MAEKDRPQPKSAKELAKPIFRKADRERDEKLAAVKR